MYATDIPLARRLQDAERRLHQARERVRRSQRHFRQSIPQFLRHSNVLSIVTVPVIYSLIVPFMLVDLWTTVYQLACFPVYGIARVRRGRYFVMDRHTLQYLNPIEQLHCTYCSYANGVIAYVREVAGRTETYWCPIKHGRAVRDPHRRYRRFAAYGDARGYRQGLASIRRGLRVARTQHRRRHGQ